MAIVPVREGGELPEVRFEEEICPENGFCSKNYLAASVVVAAVAAAVFSVCFSASMVFVALSAWCLWSAALIAANRVSVGTCMQKPVHLLYSMAMEVNSGVKAAALFPFTLFGSYHKPQGNLAGRPILMINGYLSFGSTWHYQRQRLIEAGLGPVYTMNVGSFKSIETYAKYVKERVDQIKAETGRSDITLICHSKGGLVGSYYATHFAEGTDVAEIITIGSPLSGTPVAYIGPGYDASEMRPNSDLVLRLRDKIRVSTTRFFHIASKMDEVVPFSSAHPEGHHPHATKHMIEDIGHLGLVFSSRVADKICQWLKECDHHRHHDEAAVV